METIAIDVVLADNDLSGAERSLLQSRVAGEASGLIQDLGLPAVAQLQLVDRTRGDREGSACMAIDIEGRRCRQPALSSHERQFGDLRELVSFASAVLYANRHLLLTERVLRSIATTHPTHVVGLVAEIVRRGQSLDAAERIAGNISATLDAESRRYLLELLLGDLSLKTLALEVGESLHRDIEELGISRFSDMIRMMRDGLFYELGVLYPPVRLVPSGALPTCGFRFSVLGLRGPLINGLRSDEFLVNTTALDVENSLKISAQPIRNPATGVEWAVVKGAAAASRCELEMKVTTWDTAGYAVLVMADVLRANAEQFITANNVQTTLAQFSEAFPLLVVNILERFSPRFLLDVLRALVRDGFSVRDLRGILEAMLEINGLVPHVASEETAVLPPSARLSYFEEHPADYQAAKDCGDNVRVAMKRYVTSQFAKRGEVTVLEISDPTEARLRRHGGRIRGQEHEWLVGALVAAINERRPSPPVVVLTAVDLRRRVREAIEIEFPHVAVVCREELEEGIEWHDRSHIGWPGA